MVTLPKRNVDNVSSKLMSAGLKAAIYQKKNSTKNSLRHPTHRLQTHKASTVKLQKYMVHLQLLETITTTTTTKTSANQSWQLHFFEKLTSKFLTIIVLLFPPKAFLSNLVRTESRKGTAGKRIQMSSEISNVPLPTRF